MNLGINWSIPILKKSIKRGGKSESVNLPSVLSHHQIYLSININNVFNNVNRSGYIGNQLSPFFHQPTVAGQSRSITFGMAFLYF